MAIYIQEADTLYHRAPQDKEELVAVGVSRELIEDLPQRLGALIETEKKATKWRKKGKKDARRNLSFKPGPCNSLEGLMNQTVKHLPSIENKMKIPIQSR